MCGLVGMAGTLTYKCRDAMKDMLFLNTLRGKDSTGLACVKRDGSIMNTKRCVAGYEFLELPVVDKSMDSGDAVWLAHGRYRTIGAINRNNAQPFEIENEDGEVLLVGAHNGTLDNKFELERELRNKYDTDSEGLMNLLVEAKNVKEAISMCRGAWSLVWWDAPNRTLNFLRNKERPLCYAFSKDRKIILWASESWMIYNSAKRQGIDLDENERGISCHQTIPDRLYSIVIPLDRDKVLPELKTEGGYTGHQPFFQQVERSWRHWNGIANPNHHDALYYDAASLKEGSQAPVKETEVARKEVGKVVRLFEPCDPNMRALLEKAGCCWCKGPLEVSNYGWLDEDSLVCFNCLYDRHPKELIKNVAND